MMVTIFQIYLGVPERINLGLYCLPRFWTVTWSWGTRFSQSLCCCYSTAPPPRGMPVTTSPQTTPYGTWSPTPASPG